MVEFLAHLVITAALLLVIANFVKGIHISGWGGAFIAALVLGLVNATLGTVLYFLAIPLRILTLGLFSLVISAFLLMITAALVPGFKIDRFGSAFLGALLLAIFNMLIAWVTAN